MTKLKIYIATHKDIPLVKNDVFEPIQVGRANKQPIANIIGDDTGDNISAKNPNFCELTALYWIWKNDKTSDIIGLCHYRRYFDFNPSLFQSDSESTLSTNENKNLTTVCNSQLVEKKVENYLKKYDIIVPKKKLIIKSKIVPMSLANEYKFSHIQEDYDIMIDVLKDLFGDKTDYDYYFRSHFKIIHYNMFITRKEVIFAYCEWLFKIMDELEKRVKISAYIYQSRVFGFLSERLFTLYMHQSHLKIKYLPIVFFKNL